LVGNVFIYLEVIGINKLGAQGSPSMVKGVGFRSLSFRGSWVQIPPPAPILSIARDFARAISLPFLKDSYP
jgi:hypothetical protein